MKKTFAVILILVMALSLCACGEIEHSVGDLMYEKYGALIDKLEAGDYDGVIAAVEEMKPIPPETVVEITPENFWDYYELAYSEPSEKDAQGNIKVIYSGKPRFTLKAEYSNINFGKSSIEVGYTGDCRCKKIESIDWSTGEFTLASEYYDDVESLKLNCYVSETAKGNENIPLIAKGDYPCGFWYETDWYANNGWITSEDNLDNAYFFTLENVEIVRAEGTLVILNG